MGRRSAKAARGSGAAPSFDTVGMTILPGRALPEWAEPSVEDVAVQEAEADPGEVLEATAATAGDEVAAAAEQAFGNDPGATDQDWVAAAAQQPPSTAAVGAPGPAYAMAGAAMAGAAMSAAAPPAPPPTGAYTPAPPGAYSAPPAGPPAGAYGGPAAPSPTGQPGTPPTGLYAPPDPGPTGQAEPAYAPAGSAQSAPAYTEPSRYPAAPAAGLSATAGTAPTAPPGAATASPAAAPDTRDAPAGHGQAGYGHAAPGQAGPARSATGQAAPGQPDAAGPPESGGAVRAHDASSLAATGMAAAGLGVAAAASPTSSAVGQGPTAGAQLSEPGMAATGTQTLTAPPTDAAAMGQRSQAPVAEPDAAPSQAWGSVERPELSAEHVALLSWWADVLAAGSFPTPPGPPRAESTLEPPPTRPTKGRGRQPAEGTGSAAPARSFPTKAVVIGLAAVVALGAAVMMGPRVLASEEPVVVPATELTMPATVGDLVAITDPAIGIQLQPLIGFGLRPKGVSVTAAYGPTTEGPLSLAAMSTRMGAPAEPGSQIATWAARSGVATGASVSGSGADQGITCAAAEATATIPAGSLCVWTGSGMRGQTFSVETPVEDAMALTADLRAGMTTN